LGGGKERGGFGRVELPTLKHLQKTGEGKKGAVSNQGRRYEKTRFFEGESAIPVQGQDSLQTALEVKGRSERKGKQYSSLGPRKGG